MIRINEKNLGYFTLLLYCILFLCIPLYCEANEVRLHKVYALDEVFRLRMNEKYDEALKILTPFLENSLITPYERGWGLHEKSCLLRWKGQYISAIEIIDEVISTYAYFDDSGVLMSSAFFEKSKVLSKMGHHQEAIAYLEKAVSASKRAHYDNFDPEVRVLQMAIRMGRYLFEAGETQAACSSLEDTISKLEHLVAESTLEMQITIYCELSVAYKESVPIYKALNKREMAIRSAEKALERAILAHPGDKNHPWIHQMERLLDNTAG